MPAPSANKVVVVTGDIMIDWNLARSRGPEAKGPAWLQDVCSHVSWQPGGAPLLANIIEAIVPEGYSVRQPAVPSKRRDPQPTAVSPEDPNYHHSHASWMLCPYTTDKDDKKAPQSWRIHEFLGINCCGPRVAPKDWERVQNDDPDASLVVLDDAALGFNSEEALWPIALTAEGKTPWVLLKMARIGQGTLRKKLIEKHADRLVVVIGVNDLRHRNAQISRELSWERTAQDLAWEISYNPVLSELSRCAKVIVPFYGDGAFLYTKANEGGAPSCRLLFDRNGIEGVWERSRPGRMMGLTSTLTAAVAREILLCPDKPDLEHGVQVGLHAARVLHSEGYGERGASAQEVKLVLPIEKVSGAIKNGIEKPQFSSANIRIPGLIYKDAVTPGESRLWTILDEVYPGKADEKAREVLEKGLEKALEDVPIGRFSKLITVDRQEIEGLRTIGALISEYADQTRPKRPLSVAVFGPPGAGKSFGIKQLANSIRPDEIKVLEFNMSQFQSTAELVSAFHQVRDAGLNQKLPLVFWDEFDSPMGDTTFGWLRHFLAPMQDGVFQDGGMDHPVGRAIFVFAGGTSSRYQDFGQPKNEDEKKRFETLKVPDFISRLKGFLNVLGPNPHISTAHDPFYVLRRAILFRSMLSDYEGIMKNKDPQIDDGLVNAFLYTRMYWHGARSMESIIACSRLSGRNKFERSALPPEDQLELHVDARDFVAKIHKLELSGELLEKLAIAAHQHFCRGLEAARWTYGKVENKKTKKHRNLKPYGELTEELREQNRGQVRDIPTKLAAVGYDMVPGRTGSHEVRKFPDEVVEELAIMEHARWMRQKIAAGWRYGKVKKVKDDVRKLHSCMVPWSEEDRPNYKEYKDLIGPSPKVLSPEEKKKDLDAIRSIPEILALAGYMVVGPEDKGA
jgi:hypothetical protein